MRIRLILRLRWQAQMLTVPAQYKLVTWFPSGLLAASAQRKAVRRTKAILAR